MGIQKNGMVDGPVQTCTVSPYSTLYSSQQNQHNSALVTKNYTSTTTFGTKNKNHIENLPAVYKNRGIYMNKHLKASYESLSDESLSDESVSDESLSDESLSDVSLSDESAI